MRPWNIGLNFTSCLIKASLHLLKSTVIVFRTHCVCIASQHFLLLYIPNRLLLLLLQLLLFLSRLWFHSLIPIIRRHKLSLLILNGTHRANGFILIVNFNWKDGWSISVVMMGVLLQSNFIMTTVSISRICGSGLAGVVWWRSTGFPWISSMFINIIRGSLIVTIDIVMVLSTTIFVYH